MDRAALARTLVQMSPAEIVALRDQQLAADEAEAARRAGLVLPDPVGTIRIYQGLGDLGFLLRVNEDDQYPQHADPDHPSVPGWEIFWNYRADQTLEDDALDRSLLGDPVVVLTAAQVRFLRGAL